MSNRERTPGEEPDPIEREVRRAGERVRQNVLRRGAELTSPEQEQAARASMLAIMRSHPARTNERKRRSLVPLLSAAAVLLALGMALWFTRAGDSAPVSLGPGGIRILAPRGAVPSFPTFLWEGELPTGGSYMLRILNEEGQEVVKKRLEVSHWSPEGVSLPERIRWEVHVVDRMSEPLSSDAAEAWRSP